MNPLRLALASARRAFSEPRLLATLWLANLVPALVALAPLVAPARQAFDRSPLGREAAFLDPEVVRVFFLRLRRGASPGASLLLAVGLVALLAPALAGGTLARLGESGRFALHRFAEAAARHYWRNVRLLLWAGLALVPLAVPLGLAWKALRDAGKTALFQGPLDRWRLALLAAAGLALVAWRAAFDLARALAVSRGERRTRLAAWEALRLLWRRPALLAGYALLVLAGLAAAWAAAQVHAAVPVAGTGGIALAFAAAQGFVLVRVGFSAAAYAFALGAAGQSPFPSGGGLSGSAETAGGGSGGPLPPGEGTRDPDREGPGAARRDHEAIAIPASTLRLDPHTWSLSSGKGRAPAPRGPGAPRHASEAASR